MFQYGEWERCRSRLFEFGAPDGVGVVDMGPLARWIGFALRRAQAAVAEDFSCRFGAEDIRASQFAVLMVLRQNPGLRQAQVSFALGIERTNFVPLFDELERRGLAERRRVPGDRRAAALFLSEDGAGDAGAAGRDRAGARGAVRRPGRRRREPRDAAGVARAGWRTGTPDIEE